MLTTGYVGSPKDVMETFGGIFLDYCWRLQKCSFVVSHAVVGNDVCTQLLLFSSE